MVRWFLFLVMVVSLRMPQSVHAQGQVEFEYLLVSIYPEYDRPEVLMIFQATMPASAPLPEQMSLRIPKDALDLQLAYPGTNGLDTLPYTTAAEGDWLRINFRPATNEIHWEYYDPHLLKAKQQRNFEFTWLGDYPVKSLAFEVLQPVNATQVKITPNLGSGRLGDNGLTFYSAMIGSLQAGTTFNLNLNYQKPDDSLVVSPDTITTKQPAAQASTGQFVFNDFSPWLLGLLGVALIGGGVVWYWQSGRARNTKPRHHRRGATLGEENQEGATEGVYCHQCGKRATGGDVFCRSCGTKLRL